MHDSAVFYLEVALYINHVSEATYTRCCINWRICAPIVTSPFSTHHLNVLCDSTEWEVSASAILLEEETSPLLAIRISQNASSSSATADGA